MENTALGAALARVFLESEDGASFCASAAELVGSPLAVYSPSHQLLWRTDACEAVLELPIRRSGKIVGHLAAGAPVPDTALMAQAAAYLAKLPEFQDAPPSQEQIVAAAMTELLTGSDPKQLHSIRIRIGLETFAQDGCYFNCWLLNVHPSGAPDALLAALRKLLPGHILCSYRNMILLLLTSAGSTPLPAKQWDSLCAVIQDAGAIACCSDSFFEPFHDFRLQQHLNRNEEAIYFARRAGTSSGIIFYDSYKFPALLYAALDAAPNMDNMQFVSVKIRRLMEYDEANGTEFLATLYHFLSLNLSYAHTAERMFVHRNTVVYRIAQLSERFQIHLDDPEERFVLLLSCRIIQMLERKPRSSGSQMPTASPAPPPAFYQK